MNPSTGDYDPVKFPLPRTFADLRALATRTQHPHLQKSILMWRAAVIHAHKATAVPDLHTRSHLMSMIEKYTSATVTALPSCPGFRLGRDEFGFHLRARLRLPSLLSPYPRLCASRVLQHAGVRQAMHDGARDSLLTTSVLSDHVVRPEPARFYRVPGSEPARYTKPDGLIQTMNNDSRVAFDTVLIQHPHQSNFIVRSKAHGSAGKDGHLPGVLARGDLYFTVPLTCMGGVYREGVKFLKAVVHRGDSISHNSAGDRFYHPGMTFMTCSHRLFSVHHMSCTVARAAYRQAAFESRRRCRADAGARIVDPIVVECPVAVARPAA